MKNRSRSELLRSIAGFIFSAHPNAQEISYIASSLQDDRSFGRDLGNMLWHLEHAMQEVEFSKSSSLSDPVPTPLLDIAYEAVQEHRISKRTLGELMETIGGFSVSPSALQKTSVRQLLRIFIESASSQQVRQLLEMLGAVSRTDPYLSGITEEHEP